MTDEPKRVPSVRTPLQLPDGVSQVIRGSSVPGPPPGSPPSAGRAAPVYVLVDESVEMPGYLDAVNAGHTKKSNSNRAA